MTHCGLREELDLPSVYFYLAVFEALRDIKIQWSKTKTQVLNRVNENKEFSPEEKHFLRYLLKISNAFEAVLNRTPVKLPKDVQKQYENLASAVEVKKLENYLRRQVRKYPLKLHVDSTERFSISERAYRYGNHGIYISVKEKRKRIFVLLTDANTYTRQLSVRLYPEQGNIEIRLPVDVLVKSHRDYTEHIGLSMGMQTMLTTDQGHIYGEKLGEYQTRLSDWLRTQTYVYNQNREANPGRKKYQTQKHKMEEQLHSYINQELNIFFKTEKPKIVYFPKFPRQGQTGPVRRINYHVSSWQRGYIRRRLMEKCQEQSVELIEVFAKGISSQCSRCDSEGENRAGMFFCPYCGYQIEKKINTAKNVKKRGERQKFQDHKDREPDK
jgi:transposase